MNKDDIVKKVSEILEVKFSHYDDHMASENYLPHMILNSPVRVVCYSGMCPWSFAILENMEVITPTSNINRLMLMCADTIRKNGGELPEKHLQSEKEVRKEIELLRLANKFLVENNCAETIKVRR